MNRSNKEDAYARALETFHIEARDMVQQMEQCLLALEDAPNDSDTLNALFRSVHTIKGSAGLFALDDLVRFSHEVETVLDRLRAGALTLNDQLSSQLLQCADHIADLLDHARQAPGAALPPDLADDGQALLKSLRPLSGLPTTASKPSRSTELVAVAVPAVWHISLRFAADSFLHGIDPLATLRYLASLGEIEFVETFDARLPALAELSAETCYLGFELRLRTEADQATLDDAFEFIRDQCVVHLLPPNTSTQAYIALIEDLPDDASRLGEILVGCGAVSASELHRALASQHSQAAESSAAAPLGEILIERGVEPELVDAALRKQSRTREQGESSRFLRVDADKLDALINVVGELVILSAATKLQAEASGAGQLVESSQQMTRLIEEIRNGTLALRMVPIGESFSKYKRVVRDIANGLGKDVRLELEGQDTELDKSVVEKIGDPLLHLVRNALDHGLELPAQRLAAGKPEQGLLKLSAWHDSGSIVLQVRDDGRGIDTERVLAKARERGLLAANANPGHDEILNLIFEPGFSTAQQLSDLSGRGVGMDVVKRNIEALRGSVQIASQRGRGCCMTIRLPLTLAIIDGFLVRCAGSNFIVPLDQVEECISGQAGLSLDHACTVIEQRNRPLPVLSISRLMHLRGASSQRPSIVVVRDGVRRAGLLVDQLLGEHQTVIKPLSELFSPLRCLAGSTILGSGEVALILDVPALIEQASQAHRASRNSHTARQRLAAEPQPA
ncbi:chemotaxis protein CheA [Pseudomarimonas arenosa]|uniref:Chemotaxis protein CheA n=1 Tax=Pseudomarimonas arenosa TaxID=2774145 RepID=A0AAW3ZNW1_9GAMM|nr:chemotaxis protein CheA [Pseudomarimonas arenosa]MBD8527195.1 chemotaxis protein CheA [Pseudomarimonas arenosa]